MCLSTPFQLMSAIYSLSVKVNIYSLSIKVNIYSLSIKSTINSLSIKVSNLLPLNKSQQSTPFQQKPTIYSLSSEQSTPCR